MDAEPAFVDTNILLTATDSTRAEHRAATELLEKSLTGQLRLFICGQVIREYLVVATRPVEQNGLGMSSEQAVENIERLRHCLQLIDETDKCTRRLTELVDNYKLRGKRIHDANIASIMIENGLKDIYTLNSDDFGPFSGLRIKHP